MSNPTTTPQSQPPGLITSSPHALQNFDLTAPILRFDFPTPAAQATFHRAFLQVRNEKDKAAFMQRFFDNYDGQVSIPRRVIMDTSRDEEMARRLQDSLPVEVDTGRDEEMARRLQGRMGREMGVGGNAGRMNTRDSGSGRTGRVMDRVYGGERPDGMIGGVNRPVRVDADDEAWRVQRRIERQRELQAYGIVPGGGFDGGVDRVQERFAQMGLQDRGQYPGHAGSDYVPSHRNRRLPPRYPEDQGHRGNGGGGYGYDPRWENWDPRGGRY